MQGQRGVFLLTLVVVVAIPVSMSFNIKVTNTSIYTGEQQDFFGYKVLQFTSGSDKGIIITAPMRLNGSGGVFSAYKDKTHWFSPIDLSLKNQTIPVKHVGLAIAADSTGSDFTVCSPSVAHECDGNSYLNSVCYAVTPDMQQHASSTPAFQECTKKTVDLVFLFDGSGSMTQTEFNNNKDFIVDIIDNLKNSSIKFAAVQFSFDYRKVFDFNDYQAGTALDKLQKEPHMKSLTNTHKALKFVLEDILENPAAGASPEATKVLVLITDGDPSDTDKNNITQTYYKKNILRFVIGVKVPNLDKFEAIASKPKEKYAFKIENYAGLTGILENFQKKIFEMEGSKEALAENMTDQMSQSGFSAVIHKDALILGSVGSNRWRGSLQEIKNQEETQIKDSDMQEDSYMGYSISVGEKDKAPLYFTGAPRFDHTGQVVLFRQQDKKWIPAQRLNGAQIGSYFGAELCSVDIDSDGDTDFLLVGAPLFYHAQEKREGQIYVYTLTEKTDLKSVLNVTAPSTGRFGTTISSLADLNGDGLRDVAVGAPLEDENRGAVYVYLGDRHRGIRSVFSQRIMGEKIHSGLRFFGQAIDGTIDMGEDGLPDIVIGSKGSAFVLRSKPVFNVTSHLSFHPDKISIEHFDCVSKPDDILTMVVLKVCFKKVETTKSNAGAIGSTLNLSYTLDIDPTRQTYRGFFDDIKKRNITSTFELRNTEICFKHNISMQKCVKDLLSPVRVKLQFTQTDSEVANAVVNVDSEKQAGVEIPFEKQCQRNDTCIAELVVDLNFLTPTLLVAEDNYFNITVKLSNHGEVSYNTSLIMQYPAGLSFSMMREIGEPSTPTLFSCDDLEGVFDKTVCAVSRPVYRKRSSATFKTSFYVMTANNHQYEWNDTISMTVTGKSDNAGNNTSNSMTKSIQVQFEIKMEITVDKDAIKYLNFTPEDSASKKLEIKYHVTNPGWKAFPVNVSLVFPAQMNHTFEMTNYQVSVQENKTRCTDVKAYACPSDEPSKIIQCDTFMLEKESVTEFKLSGDVHFKDLKQHAANLAFLKRYVGDGGGVKFKSFIHVSYDKKRYVLRETKGLTKKRSNENCPERDTGPTLQWSEVQAEFIIPVDEKLIVLTGVGLGLLVLILVTIIMCKLGCFKRRKLPDDDEEADALEAEDPFSLLLSPAPAEETASQSKTDGKSEPSEENKLLENNEANGSKLLSGSKEGLE